MTTQGQPIGVAPEAEKARDIATLEQEIMRRHVERLRQAGGRVSVRTRLRALAASARNVLIQAGAIVFGMAVSYLALQPLVHRAHYEARLNAVNDHVHRNHARSLELLDMTIDRFQGVTDEQEESLHQLAEAYINLTDWVVTHAKSDEAARKLFTIAFPHEEERDQ